MEPIKDVFTNSVGQQVESYRIENSNGYHVWHRENGPAYTIYNENNNIIYETYWVEGIRHREDGPALIRYSDNGIIFEVEYYVNGYHMLEDEFNDFIFKKKLQGTPMGEIFLTKV